MTKTHEFELLSIWNRATPLKEARLKFAPETLVTRLKENPEITALERIQGVVFKPGQTSAELLASMQSAIEKFKVRDEDRRAVLREINKNFLRMIDSREIRCFAFEPPRTLSSVPVEMLPEHWSDWPDWEKGEYRVDGLHLIELRIIRADTADQTMIKPQTIAPGRPNFEAAILEAFWALHSKKMIVIKPLSKTINLIRVWIKENLPETKAAKSQLSDDTIRNALKPVLKNLSAGKVEKL